MKPFWKPEGQVQCQQNQGYYQDAKLYVTLTQNYQKSGCVFPQSNKNSPIPKLDGDGPVDNRPSME